MATSYRIRPISEDELLDFHRVHEHAFHGGPLSEESRANILARIEFERTLAAFDGKDLVGAAGIYSFRMRVPGALVPVAGVTMIAVLPSHRRRGILSEMISRQFGDMRERGEAVAALFASEAGIYGRFGYGRASWQAFYTLRGGEGKLAPSAPADPGLRLRIAEPGPARAALAKVYELMLAERPGFYARNDAWWDRVLQDQEEDRAGATPLRCILAEDGAGPRGYALFRARSRWDDGSFLPESSLEVYEAMAAGPAAAAAIWGDLLSRDLTTDFQAGMRPVDDPLLYLLADPRRVRAQVSDGLWVRLADVGGALSQRRYACPVVVTIEVTDRLCPGNEGRWRLSAGPAAAGPRAAAFPGPGDGYSGTCERSAGPADLAMPVEALGSAYLGGTRLGPLAGAGLITEITPGAVAALSAAMSWDPAPWCPLIF